MLGCVVGLCVGLCCWVVLLCCVVVLCVGLCCCVVLLGCVVGSISRLHPATRIATSAEAQAASAFVVALVLVVPGLVAFSPSTSLPLSVDLIVASVALALLNAVLHMNCFLDCMKEPFWLAV